MGWWVLFGLKSSLEIFMPHWSLAWQLRRFGTIWTQQEAQKNCAFLQIVIVYLGLNKAGLQTVIEKVETIVKVGRTERKRINTIDVCQMLQQYWQHLYIICWRKVKSKVGAKSSKRCTGYCREICEVSLRYLTIMQHTCSNLSLVFQIIDWEMNSVLIRWWSTATN